MKDDCITSCLIEFEFSSLSKQYIDPIHRALVSFPRFQVKPCTDLCVHCPWDSQPYRILSVFPCLNFCPPGINPEFVMECKLIAYPL